MSSGGNRTSTTGDPSSRGSAPAGNAVVNVPSSTSAAAIGSPDSSTSRAPALQGDDPMPASEGASEPSGASAAAPTDAPATPPAAASRRPREIPSLPAAARSATSSPGTAG